MIHELPPIAAIILCFRIRTLGTADRPPRTWKIWSSAFVFDHAPSSRAAVLMPAREHRGRRQSIGMDSGPARASTERFV